MNLPTANNLTMSSEELSNLLKLRHDNVRQAAKNLQSNGVITFTESTVKGNGRPKVVMHFDRRNSIVISAKLNDKFMGAVIDRWLELEAKQEIQIPTNFADALQLAADQAKQLELAAPKVAFVDRYVNCTGNKGFRQVCKLLNAKEGEFREFLLDNKIMYRLGREWAAYSNHIDAGRFTTYTGEGNGYAYNTAMFTPKGVQWVAGLWIARGLG